MAKGYEVHGIIRRASTFNTARLDHLYSDPHHPDTHLFLHYGDLSDASGLRHILAKVRPHEIYNLAAQSHVRVSFDQPEYTADIVATGTLRLLEATREYIAMAEDPVRFYQAGSSEMYGAGAAPQNEDTPFAPRSPYAVAKVAGFWYSANYREAYDMFVANGILFNHESPRRGETFVTRKITRALGRIRHGLQERLYLGNLDAKRDWGFAGDYVEAMWLMLQQETPGDFVVATGETYSVRKFLTVAFDKADLDWEQYVSIDGRYFRPTEVDLLLGDPSRAKENLDWSPKVGFDDLVGMMVEHDMELARRERTLLDAGHDISLEGIAVG